MVSMARHGNNMKNSLSLKYLLIIPGIFLAVLVAPTSGKAQDNRNRSEMQREEPQDTTPAEELDYHLNSWQFKHYYGSSDTAIAVLNMFFRKRNFFASDGNPAHQTLNICMPCGFLAITDGIALIYYGIRAGINCSLYTRQDLLYALIDYENGYELPYWITDRLESKDFW